MCAADNGARLFRYAGKRPRTLFRVRGFCLSGRRYADAEQPYAYGASYGTTATPGHAEVDQK